MSDTEKTKEKRFERMPIPFLARKGRIKIRKKERISTTPNAFQRGFIAGMNKTPIPDRMLTDDKRRTVSSMRRIPACSFGIPYVGPLTIRAPRPQTLPGM